MYMDIIHITQNRFHQYVTKRDPFFKMKIHISRHRINGWQRTRLNFLIFYYRAKRPIRFMNLVKSILEKGGCIRLKSLREEGGANSAKTWMHFNNHLQIQPYLVFSIFKAALTTIFIRKLLRLKVEKKVVDLSLTW